MFGQTTSTMFGQATPSMFGQQSQQQQPAAAASPSSIFGQQQQQQPTPSPFGQSQQPTNMFGQPQAQAASPSPFGQAFGHQQSPGSIFGAPQQQQQQQQQQQMFQSPHLTTQMAPVAPLVIPLPDREVQAFVDAYKSDPGNPKYAFKHLLLSVTDPSARVKPVDISDIMWAEATNKLDGMDRADREKLWPEVVHGFTDLSKRLKLQDDAIGADVQRLQATEANVKLLHRHFDTDTLPWIQRLRQKEQEVQRRLLKVVRIVEALECKGIRMPLTRGEAKVGEQLRFFIQQLQGAIAEMPRKVDGLLSRSRMQIGVGQGSTVLLGQGKIDEQSLSSMQEVIRQQTEAIAHLTTVLKRDMRDLNIIVSENVDANGDVDSNSKSLLWNAIKDSSKPLSPFRMHLNRPL